MAGLRNKSNTEKKAPPMKTSFHCTNIHEFHAKPKEYLTVACKIDPSAQEQSDVKCN